MRLKHGWLDCRMAGQLAGREGPDPGSSAGPGPACRSAGAAVAAMEWGAVQAGQCPGGGSGGTEQPAESTAAAPMRGLTCLLCGRTTHASFEGVQAPCLHTHTTAVTSRTRMSSVTFRVVHHQNVLLAEVRRWSELHTMPGSMCSVPAACCGFWPRRACRSPPLVVSSRVHMCFGTVSSCQALAMRCSVRPKPKRQGRRARTHWTVLGIVQGPDKTRTTSTSLLSQRQVG